MATGTGNLPATIDTVSPFDTIVSTWGNAVKNDIYALADGTGIGDGAVSTAKLVDAAVTNAKLSTTAGELGGAWQAWTPTWTNLSVGNGTVVATKRQVGKTVDFRISLTFGTTTSVNGLITSSLPVTSATYLSYAQIGQGTGYNGATIYDLMCSWGNTTTFNVFCKLATNIYVGHISTSSTAPFTWANAHTLSIVGRYEAA